MSYARLIDQPAFVIIIRAIHCRGAEQTQAFAALKARGLWLSEDQKRMAAGEFGQ